MASKINRIHVQPAFDPLACDHDGSRRKLSGKWNKELGMAHPLYIHVCRFCGKCPQCFKICGYVPPVPVPAGRRADHFDSGAGARKRADHV